MRTWTTPVYRGQRHSAWLGTGRGQGRGGWVIVQYMPGIMIAGAGFGGIGAGFGGIGAGFGGIGTGIALTRADFRARTRRVRRAGGPVTGS